ncbi:hypothetical protein BE18_37325 [Sorangium cellulosum]|uniref:Uncharacterized protein n=1 Tax=Sorangium cellulosum TaxID=56 RepID=A0A150T313_SORCE|nr:hypothetical protein BE18_37325 [Sorangium cellulosum]
MLPTRTISPYSSVRRSFACVRGDSSPTSSRKSVPSWAASNRPSRGATAPVNAPRSWPKSSLSTSDSDRLAQFTFTNRSRGCRDMPAIHSATTSLPVPVSPRIRTGSGVGATVSRASRRRRISGSIARKPG